MLPHTTKMKIAVVGCGALGSFYGGKLLRTGLNVTFLLRSDYTAVRQRGLLVRSRDGDFQVHPRAAQTPGEIGPVDLVLIGLKTTANDQFPHLLPPLVGPDTALLTLQNGLGNEEDLAKWFSPAQILGGLCFVCLNRLEPGVIHHIDHGRVVLGEFQRPPIERTRAIARMFQDAGVPCDVTEDLARAHWEKLTWNIPFNGLGVASSAGWNAFGPGVPAVGSERFPCLTTDRLLADARWAGLVRELMMEVIRAAQALGHTIDESMVQAQIDRTLTMGAYKPSTVIDFERGLPLEIGSLFREPLRQARSAGVSAPRLEKLVSLLEQLTA